MALKLPYPLVETEWLENNLNDPSIRIIDCHYDIQKKEDNVLLTSGRSAWQNAHIPNSIFIDLLEEVSDPTTDLPFMQPSEKHFSDIMSQKGIGDETAVVIYDREKSPWAARLWFMFREFGFNNVAILNGGWKKWMTEGRSVSTYPFSYSPATFTTRSHQPSFFTNKEEVFNSLKSDNTTRICGLDRESFIRKHIPGSLNIDARNLFDPEDNTLLQMEELNRIFDTSGVKRDDRIITYCGGSIAGSCVAFVLILLGYENVSVYDGSMEEWGRDPGLPTE